MLEKTNDEIVEAWFNHIAKSKSDSLVLQRAAYQAKLGNRKEAFRLKSQVDNAPRIFDGAFLEPAVRGMLAEVVALRAYKLKLIKMVNTFDPDNAIDFAYEISTEISNEEEM